MAKTIVSGAAAPTDPVPEGTQPGAQKLNPEYGNATDQLFVRIEHLQAVLDAQGQGGAA